MRPELTGLYVLLDAGTTPDLERLCDAAIRGGARLFQYRSKAGIDRSLLIRLSAKARAAGAVMIVNDDPAALDLADGLHLGQEDLRNVDLAVLRRRYPEKILGISAHEPSQLAIRLPVDYFGVGPYRTTLTKTTGREVLGPEGLRRLVVAAPQPVCAIGGIEESDLSAVAASGAQMFAVVGAVAKAPDPESACRRLIEAWAVAG